MRDPAPPYRGEGEHALWHVSEDPGIAVFRPHRAATAAVDEPLVWAVDTRHLPLYRLPADGFQPYKAAGGYWISRATAELLEVQQLRNVVELHHAGGIELRVLPRLLELWDDVIASTLEFSGMRLRNARR